MAEEGEPPSSKPVRTKSRVYCDINRHRPDDYFDLAKFDIKWLAPSGICIKHQIGHGHFGEVFLACIEETKQDCVIKILKPVKKEKIKKEIHFLDILRGGPNIIQLLACVKVADSKTKCLIFEHVAAPDFKDFFTDLTDMEVRFYTFELLRALDYTHSQGIMHRDIKPLNVLIDPRAVSLRVIDWGLADFYFAGRPIRKWPGTRCYKSPELLLNYEYYDYSVDLWAVGCMLGGMLLQKHPLFRGKNTNGNQLNAIVKYLGSDDFNAYLERFNIRYSSELSKAVKPSPGRPWSSFVSKRNKAICVPEAFDLLSKLCCYDHVARITASEALAHPYFDTIRPDPEAVRVALQRLGASGAPGALNGPPKNRAQHSSGCSSPEHEPDGG